MPSWLVGLAGGLTDLQALGYIAVASSCWRPASQRVLPHPVATDRRSRARQREVRPWPPAPPSSPVPPRASAPPSPGGWPRTAYDLVLVARDGERLRRDRGGARVAVEVLAADLGTEEGRERVAARLPDPDARWTCSSTTPGISLNTPFLRSTPEREAALLSSTCTR